MLFEPVPIEPSGVGRLRTLATAAIPVVLLAGVLGMAIAGSPGGTGRDVAGTVENGDDVGAVPDGPVATSGTPPGRAVTAIRFPSRAYDLTARSVADVLDERRRVPSVTDLIAVRGWFTVHPDGTRCAPAFGPPDLAVDLCWEDGVLTDDPASALQWAGVVLAAGPADGRLEVQVPPGVSLWGIETDAAMPTSDGVGGGPIRPTPVVLIGRFGDPRAAGCTAGAVECDGAFVVERVVWTAGRWRSRPVVEAVEPVHAGLDATGSRDIAFRAFSGRTIVLSQALVPASMLDRLDPTAATATAPAAGRLDTDRLWYLRLMTPAANEVAPQRAVRWIAIDDGTGAILGTWPAT